MVGRFPESVHFFEGPDLPLSVQGKRASHFLALGHSDEPPYLDSVDQVSFCHPTLNEVPRPEATGVPHDRAGTESGESSTDDGRRSFPGGVSGSG